MTTPEKTTPDNDTDPRRRPPVWAYALVTAAVVAAIGAIVGITVGITAWTLRDQPGAKPATADTLAVSGTVTLAQGQFAWDAPGQRPGWCAGRGGYDDIREGAQVAVTGPDGTVLGIGKLTGAVAKTEHLDAPSPDAIEIMDGVWQRAVACVLAFTVYDIPAGHRIYGIEVSRRGVVQRAEDDLSGVALTIG